MTEQQIEKPGKIHRRNTLRSSFIKFFQIQSRGCEKRLQTDGKTDIWKDGWKDGWTDEVVTIYFGDYIFRLSGTTKSRNEEIGNYQYI